MTADAVLAPGSRRAVSREWLAGHRWIWVYLSAFLTWVAISVANGRADAEVIAAVFSLAPFLVLVGIGQMFVITLGDGHTDLTVPNVVSLSAFVATGAMYGADGSIARGLMLALAAGVAAAALSTIVIVGLRVPSMVATLAVGMIVQSATTETASRFAASPDPDLATFTHLRIGPISVLGVICVLIALGFGFVLHRMVYGRMAQAIGQSKAAAELAGVPVGRVVLTTYVISGCLAALAGALLGAFASPSLAIGEPYLLNSIAVVVLGGSLISGGRSNLPGIWGSAMFLLLLTTLLNTLSVGVATQYVIKGVLIILVLALMGAKKDR